MSRWRNDYARIDNALAGTAPLHDLGDDVWKSKDGRVLRPDEMDDRHLTNTIRLLRRREAVRTGLMFLTNIHNINVHELDQDIVKRIPVLGALLVEMDRRGLLVDPPTSHEILQTLQLESFHRSWK